MKRFSNSGWWAGATLALAACLAMPGGTAAAADAPAEYTNPVIPGDHPDPSIIRVGKDYWATATSSEWGPEFPLLHSTDLVNWEQTGSVFPHRPFWAVGNFWAPEISQFKNRFLVYYVGRAKNGPLSVAVAVADKPEGPYIDHGPLVAQAAGSIDPVPTRDEKGNPWLIWKEDGNSVKRPTILWAQPLNETGTKLKDSPHELFHNDTDWEGAVVEGPFVVRRGDWFYLFYSGAGCCGPGCNYALGVARSHHLLGPWEKNPANPILAGSAQWRCPGHGSIVNDPQGRYWLLYHAYATTGTVFTGREALLDEVVFGADDWPTINRGRGPSTHAPAPAGAVAKQQDDRGFHDDFSGTELKPGWEWPQDREPSYRVDAGRLVLAGVAGQPTNTLAAVMARATRSADYTATVQLDAPATNAGTAAGLAAWGDGANGLGLAVGGGKLTLWRRDKAKPAQITQADAPAGGTVWLRVTARGGSRYQFAVGTDGEHWQSVGQELSGPGLPPWDRGVRIALTVAGAPTAEARFQRFDFVPAPAAK